MKREITYDIMKGFGVIAVIAGHSVNSSSWLHQLIYSFHIPLFFIIAGYFYKPNTSFREKIKKDAKRLIIPYLAIVFFTMLYLLFVDDNWFLSFKYTTIAAVFGSAAIHSSPILGDAPRIGAAWFLLALFWCRQIYNLIQCCQSLPYKDFMVVLFAIVATIMDLYVINLPFSILPGISSMTFYFVGNMISNRSIHWPFLLTCGICWIIHMLYSEMDMCICLYGIYPIDILGSVFGVILLFVFSKSIAHLNIGKTISVLGRYSLTFYCFHALETNMNFSDLLQINSLPWYWLFLIRTTFCVLFTFAFTFIKERLVRMLQY